ncbi:UbiA family prenyltransferase [Tardiphaga sp. 538_B7_N1_4]|uniref:UbiA family prenyltransferase n=1 Tax=Tardiphaga sp. 538_B7_N1_4 TaxID=3240778 RepID=UPI003F28ED89
MIDTRKLPLIVDLDGTFLKVDSLFETFAAGLFASTFGSLLALLELRNGISAFKQRLTRVAEPDVDSFPVREELLAYLEQEAHAGREIHLATAADRFIALKVASRFPLFSSVNGSEGGLNLKGQNKADRLLQQFPDGFVYAGDSTADLPVWRSAKAAVVVSSSRALVDAVEAGGTPVERAFGDKPHGRAVWLKALRPHQWAKNMIVLVPVALGWRDVTPEGLLRALVMVGLLCMVASLTYLVNDMADLASDRKHWSKRRRGFASGAIPVRDGLLVVSAALPVACIVALLVAPLAGLCLLFYVAVTLGYSFGWKRIPLFDTFVIALLFTIRILIGIAAADLEPSAWLLTFSMFFFFSLALAKRHTEILRAAEHSLQKLEGRGYQAGDEGLTLAFGSAASMASIVIVVLYLVEEIFARQIYHTPAWLWVAPIAIFLFSCRIWVLSHRGRMTDDPVAFALRDNVSLGLGVLVAVAILLAL